MSTIIIITPPKRPARQAQVQEFGAEYVEGARTSDILRAVADQMDQQEEESDD